MKYHTPSGMYLSTWQCMLLDLVRLSPTLSWVCVHTYLTVHALAFDAAAAHARRMRWLLPVPASLFAFQGSGVLQCLLLQLLYPASRGFCCGLRRTCGCLLLGWCTALCPLSYCRLRLVLLRVVLGRNRVHTVEKHFHDQGSKVLAVPAVPAGQLGGTCTDYQNLAPVRKGTVFGGLEWEGGGESHESLQAGILGLPLQRVICSGV
jgi:hypothetical protein